MLCHRHFFGDYWGHYLDVATWPPARATRDLVAGRRILDSYRCDLPSNSELDREPSWFQPCIQLRLLRQHCRAGVGVRSAQFRTNQDRVAGSPTRRRASSFERRNRQPGHTASRIVQHVDAKMALRLGRQAPGAPLECAASPVRFAAVMFLSCSTAGG